MSGEFSFGSGRSVGGALRVVLSALLVFSVAVVQVPQGARGGPPLALSPELVSVSPSHAQGDGHSQAPLSISADGRYIVFASQAANLTGDGGLNAVEVYRRDLDAGVTARVSMKHGGGAADGPSFAPSISSDGRHVAFRSYATDLVDFDDTNDRADIFVRNMELGTTRMLGQSSRGGIQGNADASGPSISADGNWVAFTSTATNLDPQATDGVAQVYIGEVGQHGFELVSVSTAGVPGNGDSLEASVSGDGRFVAFKTFATNLGGSVSSGRANIYLRDRELETTTLITRGYSGGPEIWQLVSANGDSSSPRLSMEGTILVFESAASNLLHGPDTNGRTDIFLYDIAESEGMRTTRVSVGSDGTESDQDCMSPSISGNDRYVAFHSATQSLAAGKTTGHLDVLVFDRKTAEFKRVSHRSDGVEGNGPSRSGVISHDGRFVAFISGATNLDPGGTAFYDHAYRADRMVLEGPDEWNTPPVAVADSYQAVGGVPLVVAAPGVLTNDFDPDPDDEIVAELVSEPQNHAGGKFTLGPDGSFTYLPSADFSGTDSFTYRAFDGLAYSSTVTVTITVQPKPVDPAKPLPSIIKGTDRFLTAIAGSKAAFASADAVVIATGENFADALGGAGLAGALDSPLLLTQKTSLPGPVMTEIGRLKASKAYILGGTGAVSAEVESALKAKLGDDKVIRLQGSNRYQTADRVAAETIKVLNASGGYSGDAFIATGANFPDALGASPIAASQGMPVFLADPARATVPLPSSVKRVWITGGTAVVSPQKEAALKASLGNANVKRLAGNDRFKTAADVAAFGVSRGMRWDGVGITTGMNFPDALAAGPVLGSRDAVMLLTDTNAVPGATSSALTTNKANISRLTFFGGDAAVPPPVRTAVEGHAGLR